ncbi:lytic transglycosylase domain-containing protein [Burkholderia guangdongensis]|uniref:lytic transglycosylase domain-containing protein n=1 Tax=Burkholderia guangdongensis TaxID=1792500 RepID=UPI0015C7D557|nr:transglycosylase SLT domain-containing protein [Burkholderia guangdongensis]
MRRLLCLIALSVGVAHQASAQQASEPLAASATQSASEPQLASAALPASQTRRDARITAYLTRKFGMAKEKAVQLADIVNVAAAKYSLPPAMVFAIISIESRFKEKAKGPRGATGLMQVVPSAHRGMLRNVKDLTEPNANVDAGSKILSGYVRMNGGDMDAALKNYGGSHAYAEMVQQRVESFRRVLEPHGTEAAQFTTGGLPSAPSPASAAGFERTSSTTMTLDSR